MKESNKEKVNSNKAPNKQVENKSKQTPSKYENAVRIRKSTMRMYVALCKERKDTRKVLYSNNAHLYDAVDREIAKKRLISLEHTISMFRFTLGI